MFIPERTLVFLTTPIQTNFPTSMQPCWQDVCCILQWRGGSHGKGWEAGGQLGGSAGKLLSVGLLSVLQKEKLH